MILYIILFIILFVGPILLAWFRGDQILDALAARQRRRLTRKRIRATRALPVREAVTKALLDAESRRDEIDGRIGDALAAFRQVTEDGRELAVHQTATAALDDVEQVVLSRESQFAAYLDLAFLQSETLDVMLHEIELLCDMAEFDRGSEGRSPAVAHLMVSIVQATQKRVEIDRKLYRFGSAQSQNQSDSGFDATVV